mgnify:CR=1 FL=1
MKFNQYFEEKQTQNFINNYNQFCEDLAAVDFKKIWAEEFIPVLENADVFENESELLNEFWGRVKNWMAGNNNSNSNSGNNPANNPTFTPEANPQMHQWLLNNDPNYAKSHQRQQRLGQFQQHANQMTSNVKNDFSNAMRMFLKKVNDDSLQQQNPYLHKIANSFYNKIMTAVQPVVDRFKMNAVYGKMDNSEFERKQQGQRAQMANRLKSNLGPGSAYDRATNPNPSSVPQRAPFGNGGGY